MEKYLGNKASMLGSIESFISERVGSADSIMDVFSGTTNVSRYFRARGWRCGSNDSNRLSYVLGRSYLALSSPPRFEGLRHNSSGILGSENLLFDLRRTYNRYGDLYSPRMSFEQLIEPLTDLASALNHLQEAAENNQVPGPITQYFTKWGLHSEFASIRGTHGKRNYFSKENALVLDSLLGALRAGYKNDTLTVDETFLLLSCVLEQVVIIANVNGTFHDFNRNRLWPNSLQRFKMRLPLVAFGNPLAEVANYDAITAASSFDHYSVAYVDPPYNFRQYGAYYHLLNFIAAYPFLESAEEYLSGLRHVRGQHPDDDFTSDFSFKDRFLDGLRSLFMAIDCDHVVMSYYSGRNHWNHWTQGNDVNGGDLGLAAIGGLFQDSELFESFEAVPAIEVRQNYQSRIGEQKYPVHEVLFHGKLKANRKRLTGLVRPLANNARWALDEVFSHHRPLHDPVDVLHRATG